MPHSHGQVHARAVGSQAGEADAAAGQDYARSGVALPLGIAQFKARRAGSAAHSHHLGIGFDADAQAAHPIREQIDDRLRLIRHRKEALPFFFAELDPQIGKKRQGFL